MVIFRVADRYGIVGRQAEDRQGLAESGCLADCLW
jgi:hypothetical protein